MFENNTIVNKPNDWLVVNTINANATLDDLKQMAIQPENTQLQAKSFYEELPAVQNMFQTNKGTFDEKAFDNYYKSLVNSFNQFSTAQYDLKNFTDNLLYSEYNYLQPIQAKVKPYKVGITKIFNPTNQQIGVEGLGYFSESPFSMREIAQTQEVKNVKGESLGWTPNDDDRRGLYDYFANIIKTGDVLTLAQWDEDGIHMDPFTETSVKHTKGEYKFNEAGKPYYETLEGRNPVNKQILSPWDTVTVDGTTQDKWNFMSADDKNKSLGGSVMRQAARITPYFIPGIGQWYAQAVAGLTIANFTPQIAKMIGGFVDGNDFRDTDMYKALNTVEAISSGMISHGVSDRSMEKVWTWENLLTMVPDIFGQLKQQQILSKVPQMLKLTNADAKQLNYIAKSRGEGQLNEVKQLWQEAKMMKDPAEGAMMKQIALLKQNDPELFELYQGWVNTQNKIAKGLAIGYMTAASAGDVESIVDNFDIGARDAAWMKLGVLQAFWVEMNYWSLGDWQVEYAVGLDDATKVLKQSIRNEGDAFKESLNSIGQKLGQTAEKSSTTNTKFIQSLRGISGSDFFKKGKELGQRIASKIDQSKILTGITKESIEEMSEETFIDGSKIIYNLFSDLNLTQTKDKKINWDNDDVLSRYAMAGIGGALGGALFNANDSFSKPIRDKSMEQDFAEMSIDMFRNGQGSELYKMVEDIRNSNSGFASKNLSFSVFEKTFNKETGTFDKIYDPQSNQKLSQNDVIANYITEQLKLIEKSIFNGRIPADKDVQDIFQQRTHTFLNVKEHTAIKDDLQKLSAEFIDLYDELQVLNLKDEPNLKEEKRYKDLALEIETKQKQIEFLTSEESIGKYYEEALFNLDTNLNKNYLNEINEEDISQALYSQPYDTLNDYQKKNIDKKVDQSSERERLRIAKILFDRQAKLIESSVGPINQFYDLRKDIATQLRKIEFDFHSEKIDPIIELNNILPAVSRNGMIEFLNLPQNVNRLLVIDENKNALGNNFYAGISQLISLYNSNAQSISNDDYLTLKFLAEHLGKSSIDLSDYASDSTIWEFLKNTLSQEDFSKIDIEPEDYADYIHNIGEISLFDQYNSLKIGKNVEDLVLESGAYMPANIPFWLVYEFQLSKGDLKQKQFQQQLDIFGKLQQSDLSKNSSLSQLEEFLSKIDISHKDKISNILELIDKERQHLLEKPLEEYVQQSEMTLREIQRSKEMLRRLGIVLHAYINFSPDPHTAIGYFPAINEYNLNNGINKTYDQISINNALPLRFYMRYINDRLSYLEALSLKNINSKIPNKEKSELVTNILLFRDFYKRISNIDIFKDVIAKFSDSEFFTDYTQDYTEKDLDEFLNALSTKNSEQILQNIWMFEHEVFNTVNNFSEKNVNKLDFLKVFADNFITEKNIENWSNEISNELFTEYSRFNRSIRDIDQLFYQISIFCGDSYSFLDDLNNIMTKSDIRFAMFGDQQNQVKMIHHFLQSRLSNKFNPNVNITVDDILDTVQSKLANSSHPLFKNPDLFLDKILSIYGLQGTGKTEQILDFISKIAQKHDLSIVALAEKENISDKLVDVIPNNLISSTKIQNLDNLFKTIFGEENYNELEKQMAEYVDDLGVTKIIDTNVGQYPSINRINNITNNITKFIEDNAEKELKLGDTKLDIILIDESTQIATPKIQLLNEFIKIYNSKRVSKKSGNQIQLITTGDWRQPGAVALQKNDKGQTIVYPSNQQQLFNVRTIDLNSSIRTENNLKNINSKNLATLAESQATVSFLRENITLTLKHYEDQNRFAGDKSVDYNNVSTSYEKLIEKLLTYTEQKPEKIIIIGEKNNDKLIQLAEKYKIAFVSKENMNGVEYDYALVDIDLSNFQNAFNLYTRYLNGALTRSKKGSYINTSAFQIFDNFSVNEIKDDATPFNISLPQEKIEDYKQKRIKLINNIQLNLINAESIDNVEKINDVKINKASTTAKFNLTEKGTTTQATGDQILTQLKAGEMEPDSKVLKNYSPIVSKHNFGNETSEKDPTGRILFDNKNRIYNVQKITSKAKKLYIENLYNDKPLSNLELKSELLDFIKQQINSNIDDIDLVLYERNTEDSFDTFVDKKYRSKKVVTFALRLNINGDYQYIPIGAQLDQFKSFLSNIFKQENDTFLNEKDGKSQDILLDSRRVVEFLSPNFNLNIDKNTKVSIDELEKNLVVSSNVYILSNTKEYQQLEHLNNGREFILVSADRTLNRDSLFSIFEQELLTGIYNAKKKQLDPNNIQKQIFGLTPSRVKMVLLDRKGFKFKEWLDKISKERKVKNSTIIRSLSDSYISGRIFYALVKEQTRLLTKLEKAGYKPEDPNSILTSEEKTFVLFFNNILNVLHIVSGIDNSKILKELRSSFTNSAALLRRVEEILMADKDQLFVNSHLFTFLLQTAINGGTLYNGEGETIQRIKMSSMENLQDDREAIINYISDVIDEATTETNGKESKMFPDGIHYSAQYSSRAAQDEVMNWQYPQNIDDETKNYFLVSNVSQSDIHLPMTPDIFEQEKEVIEAKQIPISENLIKEIFDIFASNNIELTTESQQKLNSLNNITFDTEDPRSSFINHVNDLDLESTKKHMIRVQMDEFGKYNILEQQIDTSSDLFNAYKSSLTQYMNSTTDAEIRKDIEDFIKTFEDWSQEQDFDKKAKLADKLSVKSMVLTDELGRQFDEMRCSSSSKSDSEMPQM